MITLFIVADLFLATCNADDFYYNLDNVTKPIMSDLAAHQSALTLDLLDARYSRQRQLSDVRRQQTITPTTYFSDCIENPRPAPGKIARLMLELLKNLEGDNGTLIIELTGALLRSKLLVETSILEAEPDLETLIETPGVMMGEPHATFPRILSMVWMVITDPVAVENFGWCPVKQVNQYLKRVKPVTVAKDMKNIDSMLARSRFIMEEFIQHVTPPFYDRQASLVVRDLLRNERMLRKSKRGENLLPEDRIMPLSHLRRSLEPRITTIVQSDVEIQQLSDALLNEDRPEGPVPDFLDTLKQSAGHRIEFLKLMLPVVLFINF